MPPSAKPLPRFVAEPPREGEPHGRWAERLGERFARACEEFEEAPEAAEAADAIVWHPERTWAGRVFVPATTPAGNGELFGYVSFEAPAGDDEPDGFDAVAGYTEETAAANPGWRVDLCDQPIGPWRGPRKARGEMTLVWGTPLVRGAAMATAELGGETVDQCEVGAGGRFTLVALDAVEGLGDSLYLEVALWDRRGRLLATESLYEEAGEEE